MIIRKLTAEDLPTRVAWMNNPKVYQSMHFDVPVRMDKTLEWYNRVSMDNSRVDVAFVEAATQMGGVN